MRKIAQFLSFLELPDSINFVRKLRQDTATVKQVVDLLQVLFRQNGHTCVATLKKNTCRCSDSLVYLHPMMANLHRFPVSILSSFSERIQISEVFIRRMSALKTLNDLLK
jgi:hypothetical protein